MHWNLGTAIRFTLLVCTSAMLLAQHEQEGDGKKHPFVGVESRIEAGRKTFLGGCAGCHGAEANGGRGPNLVERASWHPLNDDGMYKVIQQGVGVMPAANLPEEKAWEIVAYVRSLVAPAIDVKAPGDAEAGQKVWAANNCSSCHRIGGKGGFAGPDLSNIGRTSTLQKIRRSIVDPDFEWKDGYAHATLILRDGGKLDGAIKDKTNYDIQLQLNDGTLKSVPVRRIESMTLDKGTIMPRDYKSKLSREDLNNLLSFLRLQAIQ